MTEKLAFWALDIAVVTPHLVGDDALRMGVPESGSDVDARRIVEDPDVGLFRRLFSRERLLLHEAAHRRHGRIDLLVERAVNDQGLVEPHRAQGRAAVIVPGPGPRAPPGSEARRSWC